jgi:hypothetical protein
LQSRWYLQMLDWCSSNELICLYMTTKIWNYIKSCILNNQNEDDSQQVRKWLTLHNETKRKHKEKLDVCLKLVQSSCIHVIFHDSWRQKNHWLIAWIMPLKHYIFWWKLLWLIKIPKKRRIDLRTLLHI